MKEHPEHIHTEEDLVWWLHSAATNGKLPFVEFFVGKGADVNASQDDSPEGPLQYAAGEGHLDVVRWLLDNGAKINHVVGGQTRCFALTGAAGAGHLDIVKLLVERGAEVNANWLSMTPLSHAVAYGKQEIVAYLRSVGAKEPHELVPINLPTVHAAIIKHFEKHRGKPSPLALQEIVQGDPPISVHLVPPSKEWDGQTLFTLGMSDRPVKMADGSQGFVELAIYLPSDWPLDLSALGDINRAWPTTWLLRIAHYPHETGSWPGGPSAVFANEEPPQAFAPNTQLSCLLCIADPGQFGQIRLPDHRIVTIYSLYAIYAEERDLEKRKGTRHLIELFDQLHVPRTLSINRPNVAKRP